MKRALYITILTLALFCFFALCVGAVDVDGVTYSLNNNTSPPSASVMGIVQGTERVKIPSTITSDGTEYRVTAVTTLTNKAASNTLKELYVTSEYVTELGGFIGSSNLEKIYITSPIVTFKSSCFNNCSKVKDVYIDFSHTVTIEANAFFFTGKAETQSQAVWNYGDEAINLYNVTKIDTQAFACSRIGGAYSGGTVNTIIWPKKMTYFGSFAFTNACLGGTVYINATEVATNKQFSYANSFETLVLGPDCKTIYNFNNGSDNYIKQSLSSVIILSKQLENGANRTNLFDNWGEFDLYYYSDIQAVINKQTTISGATHHVIDSHALDTDTPCVFYAEVFAGGASLKKISDTHHVYNYATSVANDSYCPLGSVTTVSCYCGDISTDKLNDGYLEMALHETTSQLCYPNGFDAIGVLYVECAGCDYTSATAYSPMISSLGYSYSVSDENRTVIASGYTVDSDIVELYNSINNVNLEIGIIFASAESVADEAPTSLEGLKYFSNKGKNSYSSYNFKVRFPAQSSESYAQFARAEFVAAAFIYDGTAYRFYQGLDDSVTVLESGFATTTLNNVLGVKEECTDDPASHTYGEFTITSEGTCTEPATGKRTCIRCGHERELVDESVQGHVWTPWAESDFLSISRSCMVEGCSAVQSKNYQNITNAVISGSTVTGGIYGSISSALNGSWDDSQIATRTPDDVTVDFTLTEPMILDRIYVKGHGKSPSTIHTYVLYEGESEYSLLGQSSFLTNSANSASDRKIPYFEPSKLKKATAVRVLISKSSYGEDYLDEIAFVKLPDTSADFSTDTITITYDTDLGYFDNDFDYGKFVETNGIISTHPIPFHSDSDMEFVGWYLDADCTEPVMANTVFTKNTTLYSKWVYSSVCTSPSGEHTCEEWTVITPSTCATKGEQRATCITCGKSVISSIDKSAHTPTTVSGVEANCSTVGIADSVVCSVCGEHISGGELLPTNGKHVSEYLTSIFKPTKYVEGMSSGTCDLCGTEFTTSIPYTATKDELSAINVGIKYTGGSYVNELFTNIASLGRVYVTSYFNGTKGGSVIDNDLSTFWNADTYVDGASYTSDYVELELPASYDVGVISLIVPNYYSYNLGEDCYVSYDIEYWDEETSAWIYLGTVSDKDGASLGANAQASITLEAPVSIQRLRASVAHATRYTPAVIYEFEVFGKASGFDYAIESVAKTANVSISGKYNDWVSGAEAFLDGDINTYWTTDIRYGGPTWALLEFSADTYITCLQFTVRNEESRTFKLEVYENGQWIQIGDTYTASRNVGGSIISNYNNTCTFNVDIERSISKIKLTLLSDAAYWVSYVHEITPYTVAIVPTDASTTACQHTELSQTRVVAPTCTSTGYTVMSCLACKEAEIRTNSTDMLTHSFGEYSVLTAATSTSVGTKISYCANCDATCTVTYEDGYEAPVVTPYRHGAPAAWAQTFDDGNYSETYDWVIPQLQKYGYRATALLSITFANTHVDSWNQRIESGVFDIGSHSYNHGGYYSGNVNSYNLLSDVVTAQYWLRSAFIGQKMLTFAAPNGATSDAVANYLTGMFIANRNGGQGYAFYNVISDLENGRSTWGNLNSYISKADQTEGDYVFASADGSVIYTINSEGGYDLNSSYANKNINLVYDESAGAYVNKGFSAGTYRYDSENYRYDFYEVGSYNLVNGEFVFVNDNSGEFKLVKATMGSYESAIDTLISKGGFTVECLHSLGSGSIYSTYNSTISKFEYLAKRGVWAPSYQDLVMYLKEAQSAKVETVSRTDKTLTINVTDELDDFMFDYALTVKVDIDDSWQSVVVTQNGVEIPLVSIDTYRASKNMSTVSCAIEDGYLYIDVVPDGGEVVITANAFLEETDDDNAQIGADIWDLLG